MGVYLYEKFHACVYLYEKFHVRAWHFHATIISCVKLFGIDDGPEGWVFSRKD